jgi:hypothetical protein
VSRAPRKSSRWAELGRAASCRGCCRKFSMGGSRRVRVHGYGRAGAVQQGEASADLRHARAAGSQPERRGHTCMRATARLRRAGAPASLHKEARGGARGARAREREHSGREARRQAGHGVCAQLHRPAGEARELAGVAWTGRRRERCRREEEASGLRMPRGAPGAGELDADARRQCTSGRGRWQRHSYAGCERGEARKRRWTRRRSHWLKPRRRGRGTNARWHTQQT